MLKSCPWCSGQSQLYLHSIKDGNENRRQKGQRETEWEGDSKERGSVGENEKGKQCLILFMVTLLAHLGLWDLQNVLAFCVIGYLL